MSLDQLALSGEARFFETVQPVECESCLLVAVVLQPANDRRQILCAPVPVQLRHVDDYRGQNRIQPAVDGKKVETVVRKKFEVCCGGEVQPTGKAGQNQAERKNVCEFVMMANGMFPRSIERQEDGGLNVIRTFRYVQIRDRKACRIDISGPPR